MRKFKLGLVSLVASAAMFAPLAATANAGTSGLLDLNCNVIACFEIEDVASGNKIEVNAIQADVECNNLNLVQITALALNQTATCGENKVITRKKK
jgi:hypothetical protein